MIKVLYKEITFNQHQPTFLPAIKSKYATTFLAASGKKGWSDTKKGSQPYGRKREETLWKFHAGGAYK